MKLRLWNHADLFPLDSAFFNKRVQNLMHEPNDYDVGAFLAVNDLCTCQKNTGADFAYYFHQTPDFCSRLLMAVMAHYESSEGRKRNGERAIELKLLSQSNKIRIATINSKRWKPVLTKWDEIATYIYPKNDPRRKKIGDGDKLRVSAVPKQIRKRTRIINPWEPHIKAWRRNAP